MVTLLADEQASVLVPLSELHAFKDADIAGAELAQRPLKEAQIMSLMMVDPASWPAILVTRTQEYGLLVVDGYHRREAARRLKCSEILAEIRAFPNENTLIEAAFEANLQHGLPSTTTTRSDYAYWLFATYPDLKQNEIARRVGLTPSTVNAAIKKREGERRAQEERQNRRVCFGGWSEEAEAESRRKEARDKELAQHIRSYVRHARRLYEELRSLDDGPRYWALEQAVDEGEKVMLYRLMQYLEHYLKDTLPPDLVKALDPPSRGRRVSTKKARETDPEASEDHTTHQQEAR